MKTPDLSDKVEQRMIELINTNQLDMCCELHIFQAIAEKYQFKTLSDYAKSECISYNGALHRIRSGREQYFKIANQILIF